MIQPYEILTEQVFKVSSYKAKRIFAPKDPTKRYCIRNKIKIPNLTNRYCVRKQYATLSASRRYIKYQTFTYTLNSNPTHIPWKQEGGSEEGAAILAATAQVGNLLYTINSTQSEIKKEVIDNE